MAYQVFISYSSRNKPVADAIVERLEKENLRCWVAPRDIAAGSNWSGSIIEALNECRAMVLIFSAASNASPQVMREVERAIHKGIGIVPFRIEDMPLSGHMEYFISAIHWLDAVAPPVEQHIDKLIPMVQTILDLKPGEELPLNSAPPAPQTPAAPDEPPPNNLPQQLTSFIGRDAERQEVRTLLKNAKLLTLIGGGGAGKTRLALQVAGEVWRDYPDGVWLVELAPISDAGLIPQEIASVLDVREEPGRKLTQTLADALKAKKTLILLDNCEHVLSACSQFVNTLMKACPDLRLLATSRERLNLAGEQVYRVPLLGLPTPEQFENPRSSPAALQGYESVQLFADRAQSAQPAFALDDVNTASVARLVYRLDGIPLAIELAAARVRAMTVDKIAERLDERFKILTGGSKSAPSRQQTLRSMLDWSYDLLSEQEAALFNRLSVFADSWTMEACEKVCASPPDGEGVMIEDWEILDLLTALTDKSLVAYDEREGEGRYHLLESVRQYSREKLAADSDSTVYPTLHRDYYLALAKEAAPQLQSGGQVDAICRLEREHDNLRSALSYSLAHTEEDAGNAALELSVALCSFWQIRGYFSEGRDSLQQTLEATSEGEAGRLRASALDGAGLLAWEQGDFAAARQGFEQSLALAWRLKDRATLASATAHLGDVAYTRLLFEAARAFQERALAIRMGLSERPEVVTSHINLGNLALRERDLVTARHHFEEALASARKAGRQREIGLVLNALAIVVWEQDEYDLAGSLFEEALGLIRGVRDAKLLAQTLMGMAVLRQDLGNVAEAYARFAEALELTEKIGDKLTCAYLLQNMALLSAQQNRYPYAVHLYAAAATLHEAIDTPIPTEILDMREKILPEAREAMGAEAYEMAWMAGCLFSLPQAIGYALAEAEAEDQDREA